MSETNWIELNFLSKHLTCDQLHAINENEFIIVPFFGGWRQKKPNCANGIYKFNILNNEWSEIIEYEKNFKTSWHGTAVDNKNKLIFIFNSPCQLIQINLETQLFKILSTSTYNINAFLAPKIINIDNKIHIIAAENTGNSKHLIYDRNTNEWIQKYQFEFLHELTQNLLHLKSRKSIFCVGKTSFYEYSLLNKKWKQWDMVVPRRLSYSAVVCTQNEQFLIFLGGINSNEFECSDVISIFDFKTNKLTQSTLKLPKQETFIAVMMNNIQKDELLAFGFVNKFAKLQSIPYYIIKFISKFYCTEFIHIVGRLKDTQKETQWKINVDCILQST